MENLKSDTYSKEIKFNWNQGFAENLEPWPEPISRAQTIKYVRSYLDSEAPSFLSRNSNRITYIDLFCGGGGLSLGVHHALHKFGFDAKLLLAADKDKKALRLIQHHFKPMIHSDLPIEDWLRYSVDLSGSEGAFVTHPEVCNPQINQFKGKVDLLVGGPPCQGFSNANRQRLIDDPRNHLYKYFVELIKEVQPRIFLMENVRGMLNKSEEIMQDFSTNLIKYKTTIFMLNAKEFGVPQHRERVFILGTNDKNFDVNEIRDELLNIKVGDFIPISQALEFLPKLGNKEQKSAYLENDISGYKFTNKLEWSSTGNEYLNKINQNKNIIILSNHMNRYNNPRDIEIFTKLPQGEDSTHPSIEEIMPYKSRTGTFKDKYFKLREDHVSKTITAHMDKDCNSYIHPSQPRGLTPREAARIQSFPDDYIFMGPKNKWYTQIGNAVPPLLAKHIGTTIKKYIL